MRTALNFPEELITSIDILNTLNGGTIEPSVRLQQFSSHRQISLRLPGLSLENVKIEIKNNQLLIYYFTNVHSQGREIKFPKILYNKSIPYFVDVDNITASEYENALVLRLPFNDLADGYQRDIPVSK